LSSHVAGRIGQALGVALLVYFQEQPVVAPT